MTKKALLFLALFFLVSAITYTLTARALGFQVVLNDFWTVFYYARNLNLSIPASLQNSLFPIGYATILHLMPVRHALWMAFYLNVALASLAVTATSALVLTEHRSWPAVLVGLCAIFYPLTFRYANTTGPDIGVVTFIALGLFFLWRDMLAENNSQGAGKWQQVNWALAGGSLALASLWRSHAIVAGLAILLVHTGIMGVKTLWQRKTLWLAFLLVAGIQVLVNLLAGHGAAENAQYFNIYKTFFGNDWLTVPKDANNQLLINLFLTRPIPILKQYLPHVWNVALYTWPAVPLYMVSKKPAYRRYAIFTAMVICLYALPVAFGSSPRAPLAITPLSFTAFGLLVGEITQRLSTRFWLRLAAWTAFLALAALMTFQWYQENTRFIQAFSDQHERYLNIERRLRAQGLTSPDEVFTNRYNFYLPTTPPYQPRSNGGWDSSILWNYRTAYPELPVGTWEEFSAACQAQGVRFLVLNPYSYELAPYFGEIYQETYLPENIKILKFVGDYQILMFK